MSIKAVVDELFRSQHLLNEYDAIMNAAVGELPLVYADAVTDMKKAASEYSIARALFR
jgi:hypothetical protein